MLRRLVKGLARMQSREVAWYLEAAVVVVAVMVVVVVVVVVVAVVKNGKSSRDLRRAQSSVRLER